MTAEGHLNRVDDRDRRQVESLYEHLASTAQRPVDRTASRWIGEAEAIVDDLVGAEVERDVLQDRIGHVRRLLANVEDTGDAVARDHVEAARDIAAAILEE